MGYSSEEIGETQTFNFWLQKGPNKPLDARSSLHEHVNYCTTTIKFEVGLTYYKEWGNPLGIYVLSFCDCSSILLIILLLLCQNVQVIGLFQSLDRIYPRLQQTQVKPSQ